MRRVAIVMIAASLATGCAESATPDTRVRVDTLPGGMVRTMSSHPVDSGRWALTAVRDIQPAELAPGELFDPQDVVVADDGSVLVADTKPTVVKVYDPAGALVRVIGREGSGPGEFRAAYLAILGDTLVVQDAANTRATTFNWRTGDLLSERRTACCYYFPIGIDAAGHAAVRSIAQAPDSTWQGAQGFVRFAINGRDADTLFVPVGHDDTQRPWVVREGGRIRFSSVVPFQPRAFHQVDAAGRFLTGYSSEYVLRRTTNGLDTLALFGRDWTAAPVPLARRSASWSGASPRCGRERAPTCLRPTCGPHSTRPTSRTPVPPTRPSPSMQPAARGSVGSPTREHRSSSTSSIATVAGST